MPMAIIMAASAECKERAKANGFTEQVVLMKHVSVSSDEKWKEEKKVRELGPYQFAIFDYWGACPD
jgi:hypothetical protein